MKPRLYVEQKVTAIINRYKVFAADESGEKAGLLCFVEQKRGALKEKVSFFADEDKANMLFSLRAEKVFDVHGKYLVEDAEGGFIGYFQKDFKQSFLKSTWHVYAPDNTKLITVTESNPLLAFLRRYLGFIPFIGEIFDLIVALFKYHFNFLDPSSGQPIGKFEKLSLIYDKYKLSLTDEANNQLDQRLVMAVAVALDALQAR